VKKMKWLGATGAVLALSAVGFVTQTSSANGATTITAGPGSRVTCNVSTGSMKISPTLSNPWLQSEHSGANADPNSNATVKAAMASIPDDSTWVANGGADTAITATGKLSATCTGTVKDATNNALTDTVTAAAVTANITTTPLPPTCSAIVNIIGATFSIGIKWTGTTAKINPTALTATSGILSDAHGTGMQLTSDPADVQPGSFASSGSHSVTNAYVDGATIIAFAAGPASFDAPTPLGTCQPAVSAKFTPAAVGASDAIAVKLKKPKGFKGIGITNGATDNTPSNLCINSTGTAAC